MIPKIIYYSWVSDKPLPDKYKPFIDGWKKLMPDYEIIEINMENCPRNHWVDEAIKRKNFILAGHYGRCQRLYETGGIYMDIDVEAIKRYDDLLVNTAFMGCECEEVVNNAIFGAEKGHPFMKECMDYMDNMSIDSPNIELETGPRMFSNLCRKHGYNNKNENQQLDGITIYDNRYFYPYPYTEQYTPSCIKPETYAIHHWAGTWLPNKKLEDELVSIIIPCYNQAQWLHEAIESAIRQTYNNIEVIVVNDGSPDNASDIAKKYPVILLEQNNRGLCNARNNGIKASHGKWILTLDADDVIDKDYIKKTIGKADVVSTTLKTFGTENIIWQPPNDTPVYNNFLEFNQIHCCSLFKREIFDKIGGFDENMKDGYEDWDFWTRAAYYKYTFKVIREPLFLYRKHGQSFLNHAIAHHNEIRKYMLDKYSKLSYPQVLTS